MDVVLAGLNDTPSVCPLGFSWAYGEGTFDEEEYILLSLGLELGDARSYFAQPQEIPVRPLLALMRLPSSTGLDLRSHRLRQSMEY